VGASGIAQRGGAKPEVKTVDPQLLSPDALAVPCFCRSNRRQCDGCSTGRERVRGGRMRGMEGGRRGRACPGDVGSLAPLTHGVRYESMPRPPKTHTPTQKKSPRARPCMLAVASQGARPQSVCF
jgi:hypothetical protein